MTEKKQEERYLFKGDTLLKRFGLEPGQYCISFVKIRNKWFVTSLDPISVNISNIPMAVIGATVEITSELLRAFFVSTKNRDDLTKDEIYFLKSLSDARYAKDWVQYKSTNYYITTKTDSTGFVKDILIRRNGNADHVHVYVDTVDGNRGMILTTNGKHYPLDYGSLDDLLDDVGKFC